MTEPTRLTGRMVAAARALAGISLEDLAAAAGLGLETTRLAENSGSAPLASPDQAAAIGAALERFGVLILEEAGGLGAGVRLKFTRLDVKQIARLEGEGGPAGDDDVP
ncbi:MAG: XRE family transcriptional regulator [Rhizobiales bacterium]|nr:XRE family transcriptional regulator [Hyphomicrobiales bacterium]